ncbi:hypothetical protein BAUCODRAFT_575157 [Baudoinia panamericana UAMH 10762]|uniref:J domain-containing protein n=1 Tax=Baudoinia panamericana (strain UAMH 10762) TaxID=717646 RepID=M2MKS1_BAUPA|nr:uncharacterized protein BAUCODRAFT_575157 [Baudoinia panamericana UAMH 10762]EMC97291.1 hypothetical protein BAUCODRAFT_575157 [Baudoinia panamericana UAMH 10762]
MATRAYNIPDGGKSEEEEREACKALKLDIKDKNNAELVRKTYRKLALEHHPDRHREADETKKQAETAKFLKISNAYNVLTNGKKKIKTDEESKEQFRTTIQASLKPSDLADAETDDVLRRWTKKGVEKRSLTEIMKNVKLAKGSDITLWQSICDDFRLCYTAPEDERRERAAAGTYTEADEYLAILQCVDKELTKAHCHFLATWDRDSPLEVIQDGKVLNKAGQWEDVPTDRRVEQTLLPSMISDAHSFYTSHFMQYVADPDSKSGREQYALLLSGHQKLYNDGWEEFTSSKRYSLLDSSKKAKLDKKYKRTINWASIDPNLREANRLATIIQSRPNNETLNLEFRNHQALWEVFATNHGLPSAWVQAFREKHVKRAQRVTQAKRLQATVTDESAEEKDDAIQAMPPHGDVEMRDADEINDSDVSSNAHAGGSRNDADSNSENAESNDETASDVEMASNGRVSQSNAESKGPLYKTDVYVSDRGVRREAIGTLKRGKGVQVIVRMNKPTDKLAICEHLPSSRFGSRTLKELRSKGALDLTKEKRDAKFLKMVDDPKVLGSTHATRLGKEPRGGYRSAPITYYCIEGQKDGQPDRHWYTGTHTRQVLGIEPDEDVEQARREARLPKIVGNTQKKYAEKYRDKYRSLDLDDIQEQLNIERRRRRALEAKLRGFDRRAPQESDSSLGDAVGDGTESEAGTSDEESESDLLFVTPHPSDRLKIKAQEDAHSEVDEITDLVHRLTTDHKMRKRFKEAYEKSNKSRETAKTPVRLRGRR